MTYRVSVVRAGQTVPCAQTAQLCAVDGTILADVDMAPPLLAGLTVAQARRIPAGPGPSAAVLAQAGQIFATSTLNGLTPDEYCLTQARGAGIPITVARRSLTDVATTLTNLGQRVEAERPAGASAHIGPGHIAPVWVRRGDVMSVIAPSNNPGVHTQWIQAVALGYRVVVRPGSMDPFTPARLIAALLAAGVDETSLSLLPGGHPTADALVTAADLSLVFGGDEAMARYADNRRVIPRGPGRSKVLHSGPVTESVVRIICDSVGYDAGMRCTNATAVFTDADPGELADAMAQRLCELVPAPPQAPQAQLPVLPLDRARTMRAYLAARKAGAVDVALSRYRSGGVADLGDGSAALRAAVLCCDRPDHPGAGVEMPFPCVWVLPWRSELGLAPLRDTLALTVLSDDHVLAAQALREPSIRKVLFGPLPTWSAGPVSPHDGFLGHALMEARAYGMAA